MKIIADSSSTRTEWAIIDNGKIVEHAFTSGLNTYFHTRREISHVIRLELPEMFFRRRWEHVFFYGAGCANPEKNKIIESSLIAQFKTPTTVESDLLGAARGLLVDRSGLACILSTGANSCMYNGREITRNVRPGGFILGDEGSNSYLGKTLVADIVKGIAPMEIASLFFRRFNTNVDEIMNLVYSHPHANRTLADYSFFLADHLDNEYIYKIVYDGFIKFFERNLIFYDYKAMPVSFVGKTGTTYREILAKAAADFGITIDKVVPDSMPGLIEYHTLH